MDSDLHLSRSARRDGLGKVGVLLAIFSIAFAALSILVVNGTTDNFDHYVVASFRLSVSPDSALVGPAWFQEMARDLTSLGSSSVLSIVTMAASGYLLLARRKYEVPWVLTNTVGIALLSNSLKYFFTRHRPDAFDVTTQVFTSSFPSDHAAISLVTYFAVAFIIVPFAARPSEKVFVLTFAFSLVLLIGSSRVYLGVHYPADVLAGWLLGATWFTFCWIVLNRGLERTR